MTLIKRIFANKIKKMGKKPKKGLQDFDSLPDGLGTTKVVTTSFGEGIVFRTDIFIYLSIRILLRKFHHNTSRCSDDLPGQEMYFHLKVLPAGGWRTEVLPHVCLPKNTGHVRHSAGST
jgi:hypothetical protein